MIELFTIFGKGGIVLWCFNEGSSCFKEAINDLIGSVILQDQTNSSFTRDNITIKYKLDNELDIIVLVVYQSIIQMAYSDKLLTEVQLRFRDLYKNVLADDCFFLNDTKCFSGFGKEFNKIFTTLQAQPITEPLKPRTFQESEKSKKTVASMIETQADRQAAKVRQQNEAAEAAKKKQQSQKPSEPAKAVDTTSPPNSPRVQSGADTDEEVLRNRAAMLQKMKGGKPKAKAEPPAADANAGNSKKKAGGKKARVWDLTGSGKDAVVLDYSTPAGDKSADPTANGAPLGPNNFYAENVKYVGKFKGDLPGITEDDNLPTVDNDDDDEEEEDDESSAPAAAQKTSSWFSSFKSLVGNKQLTQVDIDPALEHMKEILIGKNVAAEPAIKICESVGVKLEGKVIGTFNRVATIVREAMREALTQLLTPKRRVNILRDVMEAKAQGRPYVIVFCGVNGVGKSTNLAKITFWLNENNYRVLVAAGDTFRAGAVEQLRTHTLHLNALHERGVQLYEQGYGKDPAGLAAAAIQIAKEREIDVVLVDTAGRMQDNEPLMRSLSKLIHTNNPDLVLFVGEALVGNEAVDQLVKFNQALADNSTADAKPRLIDGIVLTKFDTIDDKVGAAVSMTYITGQPIVFVGTGQTYKDLKNLNVTAVVNSLLK